MIGLFMLVYCILGDGDDSLQAGRRGIGTPQFSEVLDLDRSGPNFLYVQVSFQWMQTTVNFLGGTT